MNQSKTSRVTLWIILFLLMLLDAHITRLFDYWDKGANVWQSQLLLLVALFAAKSYSKRYMIWMAVAIGILFDLYYLGIIGVYAVGFPMVVWMMYVFHSLFYQNMTTMFFSWVISLTLFQLFTLGIQIGFKLAAFDGQFFVVKFLGPTLLLNICYFFILMWPLKKVFKLKLSYF
ncbi:rod shape-determining protein MreD [Enterococcus italicus]|uniref:rod shape-determining protein MreD n=1 Tax=Enterococcus italicus TaxID=246144 RepID=UPI003F446435